MFATGGLVCGWSTTSEFAEVAYGGTRCCCWHRGRLLWLLDSISHVYIKASLVLKAGARARKHTHADCVNALSRPCFFCPRCNSGSSAAEHGLPDGIPRPGPEAQVFRQRKSRAQSQLGGEARVPSDRGAAAASSVPLDR